MSVRIAGRALFLPFMMLCVFAVPSAKTDAASEDAALATAQAYERLGDLAKAEEQFVAAAQSADSTLREVALQGLRRVRQRARHASDVAALVLAGEYEKQHRWEQARDEYANVMKTATGSTLAEAIAGMRRTHAHEPFWTTADVDALLLWLGKAAALLLVLFWAARALMFGRMSRRSVRVFPFLAGDDASKEMTFWVAYARASLRTTSWTPGLMLVRSGVLPLIDLPGLPSDLPEIEDLAFGELKIPLKNLLGALARPRVRVSGGWVAGAAGGRVYAEIEQRRWVGYSLHSTVRRAIAAGAPAQRELELFGYDVIIRADNAHGSG